MKKIKTLVVSLAVCQSLSLQATDCIDVVEGWNLKGTSQSISTQVTFSNSSEVEIVWGYDNSTQTWSAFSPRSDIAEAINQSYPTLYSIDAGKGYWVKSLINGCLSTTSSGNENNHAPMIYGIGVDANQTHVIYVAKGVAVNMDLQNYIQDLDNDTVAISTSNIASSIAGITIGANGQITGTATTVGQQTTFNATLNDGSTTTMSNLKIVVIDMPNDSEPIMTYGTPVALSAFNLNSIGTFFEPDVEEEETVYTKILFGSGTLNVTEYALNGTSFTQQMNETLTPANLTATSFNLSFTNEPNEKITVLSAKPVLSIGGQTASGLYEATVEFETTSELTNYANITDWWDTHYTDNDTTITTISALQTHLINNPYSSVWINENTQVRLLSGGSVQLLTKDGTYESCQQCNNGLNYYERLLETDTIYSGTTGGWGINLGYLKVGVAGIGAALFKEDGGAIVQTELKAVGFKENMRWFYGITEATFRNFLQTSSVQP